jgi:hypothetical protein
MISRRRIPWLDLTMGAVAASLLVLLVLAEVIH